MKDWLKLKKYTHFSPPLEKKDISFIRSYVADPLKVKQHRFYPFIHFTIQENRFRRGYNTDGSRQNERTLMQKKREIFYANHLDSQVFAYYGHLMNQELEKIYEQDQKLSDSVIAYRRIPFNEFRNKCNIDFAKEVFDFIRNSGTLEVSVVCFDIKSFFDSLDHKILKKAWCKLFGETSLSADHFQVYKAITRFTYVEVGDLIKEFKELKIKKVQYLKRKGVPSFSKSGKEFRSRVIDKGLINFNKYDFQQNCARDFGIAQGSPISAVLSNLYLLELDKELVKKAEELQGLYRRYSDDLIFICQPSKVAEIKAFLLEYVKENLRLIIQDEKTQEVTFARTRISKRWNCTFRENGLVKPDQLLTYLGFVFDGQNIRVKQKGISQYYRKLKRMIRRRAKYARYAKLHNQSTLSKKKDAWIYRQRIYKTKSHLGAKRKRIDGRVFWGNYISYINTASKVMNEPALSKQIRNHWRIIERQIKEYELAYDLDETPSRRGSQSLAKERQPSCDDL